MIDHRTERHQKMLADFPKGTVVRVKDPDGYIASVATKLRDRLGEVTGHQMPSPNPIVTFHAVGRRKRHQMVFAYNPERDLEIVTDACAIADWRDAVKATESKAAKLIATKQKSVPA